MPPKVTKARRRYCSGDYYKNHSRLLPNHQENIRWVYLSNTLPDAKKPRKTTSKTAKPSTKSRGKAAAPAPQQGFELFGL
ncbi:hypothetical protein WOLCODRAFT_149367 [Wolfiporia cocos MD-104 SS10]|uniref:Uncharacterized protein n=1 Tax=Wolfiporia cocos (strain MD-104) TaxID=742152 RepID=A0A2H3JQY6_WOLCO|nr:hypothetical protein WOLCODRAFT_149367 [Wolfiporia cocos MD-104 SS10]